MYDIRVAASTLLVIGSKLSCFWMWGRNIVGRVSPPNLQRMHVETVLEAVEIEQYLCCFAYSGDRFERVIVTKQRKVGYCIELEKVWACNQKEIAYHQVRSPGIEQFREAVENVIGFFPLFL